MTLVDVDYKCVWVNVGSEGSSNAAGIFNSRALKEGLDSNETTINIPTEESLPGDDVPIPYFLVADNGFGINRYLMDPFALHKMPHNERAVTTDCLTHNE